MSEILAAMKQAKVVPVVRTSTRETAERAVEILRGEGFAIFEMTLTTPGAVDAIRTLAERGDAVIGAGTVLSGEDALRCIEAGARFIVSPALRPDVVEACAESDVDCFLGAATPTEVLQAHELGCAGVKIFPAAQLGGPAFLGALKSVFPDIDIMPTGGIGAGDIAAYLQRGAFCVGMGGKLVDEAALVSGNTDTIANAAREVLDAVAR